MHPFPVEFCFDPAQKVKNSSVSAYLNQANNDPAKSVSLTETSTRPVYYHIKNVMFQYQSYRALYYVLFYTDNPGYDVCCRKGDGYHTGDVERIVVLFDSDNKAQWVFFGAHGRGQGKWVPFAKCSKAYDGVLRVYVSPTSHAMYPKPKRYRRVFGFADDVIRTGGEQWRP